MAVASTGPYANNLTVLETLESGDNYANGWTEKSVVERST